MRQMTALQKIHAHDGIAHSEQPAQDRIIGGRAGKRLHIDEQLVRRIFLSGEQLSGTAARQRFDDIGVFRPLVIALVCQTPVFGQTRAIIENFRLGHRPRFVQRVALGIDVVERRRQRLADCLWHCALGRDHDQVAFLPRRLMPNQFCNIGIEFRQLSPKQKILWFRHSDQSCRA